MALHKISFTNVDFPLPDTPVTQINFPSGNLTLIFFKLFSLAPFTSIYSPFPLRRFDGTGILYSPERYFPVIEWGFFMTSSGVPAATT